MLERVISQMNETLQKEKLFFQIVTLGCKVNQYESEQIRQILLEHGFLCKNGEDGESVSSSQAPDWVFINTCAVTQESEAKSRKIIRQLKKRYDPARIVVFGCSAENNPEQFRNIPGVTDVIQSEKYGGNRLAAVLDALNLSPDSYKLSLLGGLRRFGERHRAYIKVQDGCKQFCTYCLIPHLRHELTSVPPEEVLAEAQSLIKNGYKEIIVTGIHLGYYGLNPRSRAQGLWTLEDRKAPRTTNLTQLMEQLATMEITCENQSKKPADFRLRISSLEAHEAGDDLLHIMAENRTRICPHLHLSMQSGSPTVHHRMNRPGTIEQYMDRCSAAKRILDSPALTTDIIVGFPGETEKEFLETCDVVRQIGFSKIHIFPFSARPGTPAAAMGDQIPAEEKHRRELFLAEIEREMHAKFVESLRGRKTRFLAERFHPETNTVTGTSEYYIQEEFPGTASMVGTFVVR